MYGWEKEWSQHRGHIVRCPSLMTPLGITCPLLRPLCHGPVKDTLTWLEQPTEPRQPLRHLKPLRLIVMLLLCLWRLNWSFCCCSFANFDRHSVHTRSCTMPCSCSRNSRSTEMSVCKIGSHMTTRKSWHTVYVYAPIVASISSKGLFLLLRIISCVVVSSRWDTCNACWGGSGS